MWRAFTFIIVFGISFFSLYSAFTLERSVQAQALSPEAKARSKKLLLIVGFFFLFIGLCLVYVTIMQLSAQSQ